MAHLILVEGMIGAGKSTTSEWIADWLTSRGEHAVAYPEFAPDHPIRTRAVDRLRSMHPEPVQKPGDIGADGLSRDASVYEVRQWSRLAEDCVRTARTVVLEATFLQNSVLPAFINGAPVQKVLEIARRIEHRAAPASPLLVYLRPTDIPAAIDEVHRQRGEPWASWNLESVESFPWVRERDLHGKAAVVELYRAWEWVVDEVFARYPYPKVMVLDPQRDWAVARRTITEAARFQAGQGTGASDPLV
jgi:predicted kinase